MFHILKLKNKLELDSFGHQISLYHFYCTSLLNQVYIYIGSVYTSASGLSENETISLIASDLCFGQWLIILVCDVITVGQSDLDEIASRRST